MKKDFVTIKTFTFPGDVPVVQSYLEMMGIETFMKNLTTSRLAYTLGDIDMQVRASDYESAKKALIEGGFSKPEDFKV